MLGCVNRGDALQRGSSGKIARNLSSLFLKDMTGLLVMELILGVRQFQRLQAVRANEESRGIPAGLWWRVGLGREQPIPPRELLVNLRANGFAGFVGYWGRFGARSSLILYM